jgi:hypothetical protein
MQNSSHSVLRWARFMELPLLADCSAGPVIALKLLEISFVWGERVLLKGLPINQKGNERTNCVKLLLVDEIRYLDAVLIPVDCHGGCFDCDAYSTFYGSLYWSDSWPTEFEAFILVLSCPKQVKGKHMWNFIPLGSILLRMYYKYITQV